MGRTRLTKPSMVAGLLVSLMFAIMSIPLGAQPVPESRVRKSFGPVYDAAHEIILNGDIQQVITNHVAGSPAGTHILVASPNGLVDAHLGPFLSKEVQEALHTGAPVQIVGAMTSMHGKSYLLARELNIGGSIITVRSKHGALVHEHSNREHVARSKTKPQIEATGGAR